MTEPLLELQHVEVTFGKGGLFRRAGRVKAVVDVSLQIEEGEILALVGESGCGKTTLGRVITGLQRPTSGRVLWRGQDIRGMGRGDFMSYRLGVQIVHQDSFAALNPVRTILQTLSGPLRQHAIARSAGEARERAASLLETMGLTPPGMFLEKYPHQLSGGQRQRVVLARAMAARPRLIVADEPVSMVDVSLRLSLLNLMFELNAQQGLAFLYITHDLATARYFAQQGRVVVMYLGDIVEIGPLGRVLERPRHPYLQALLSAVLVPDPRITRQRRELPLTSLEFPDPGNPPPGCRFHTRCPYARAICSQEQPPLSPTRQADQLVSCHFWEEIPLWPLSSVESPSP
jgi:peptide/nickel transport system ATP-binding protein